MTKSLQITLCEGIAKTLQGLDELTADGAVIFVEDAFDPAKKVAKNSQTLLRVQIATTGHVRATGSGESTAGDISLEIVVYENPARRSANPNALTVTRAAELIADALHWKKFDGFEPLRYIDMARQDADETDYRMVINLAVNTALDPTKAVTWGIGEDCAYGRVTRRTIRRGGTVYLEPGQGGDVHLTGSRDLHWEIDLEASSSITDEEDLPVLGGTFAYGGRTYVCESAEMVSTDEDTTTVHLTGRTTKENT